MRKWPLWLILGIAAVTLSGAENPVVKKGEDYLLTRQGKDGSWGRHPAITGLVCMALHGKHPEAIGRGRAYLLKHVDPYEFRDYIRQMVQAKRVGNTSLQQAYPGNAVDNDGLSMDSPLRASMRPQATAVSPACSWPRRYGWLYHLRRSLPVPSVASALTSVRP